MLDTAGGSTSAPDGDAAIPASPSPTAVNLPCPCPGHPHEFDTVSLRSDVSNRMGMAVGTVLRLRAGDEIGMQADLGMVMLRFGIAAWTFTDHNGPVPIDEPIPTEIVERWLPFARGGFEVIEAANSLLGEEVFRPFVRRMTTRSPDGPEEPSTSATTDSGPTPLKRSRPSSRIASDGTRLRA